VTVRSCPSGASGHRPLRRRLRAFTQGFPPANAAHAQNQPKSLDLTSDLIRKYNARFKGAGDAGKKKAEPAKK